MDSGGWIMFGIVGFVMFAAVIGSINRARDNVAASMQPSEQQMDEAAAAAAPRKGREL